MTSLLATTGVSNAIEALTRWSNEAGNRSGRQTAAEAINGYREWAAEALKALALTVSSSSMDELLFTARFRVLSTAAPADYGFDQLGMLARDELQDRAKAFKAAADELQLLGNMWDTRLGGEWSSKRGHAAVVDTNLLMVAGHGLREQNRNDALDLPRTDPVAIVVPLRVIKELDRHKTSAGAMDIGCEKPVLRRTLARRALIALEELLGDEITGQPVLLNEDALKAKRTSRPLWLLPLVDQPAPYALGDADAEIIDCALSLTPLANTVTLLTGDTGMLVQARAAGLKALRPEWVGL